MKLSNESIKKFQELYKRHFGVEISCSHAESLGNDLISLFSNIIKPATKNEYEQLPNREGGNKP